MKKSIKFLALVVAMVVLATLVVACTPTAQETKYTVTFDADGGTPVPAAQEVKEGEKATKPQDPTKTNFKFLGWYNGDTKYTFEEAVTSDITLKAKWEAVSTEPTTATTKEVTYTGQHGPANVTIKLAIEYEVESHKIVELILAEDNVYCTGNWADKWEAGFDAVVESYIGMTLEEVVAIDTIVKGDENVVSGATESSRGLLAAVQMAALTVVSEPIETATTEEVTYTTTIGKNEISIKLALKYEVESHKIVEIVFGDCVFTTGGNFETTWEAGKEVAIASYVGKTLEEVVALDAPSGSQVVTGATRTSAAVLEAIKMAAGTVLPAPVETATTEEVTYTTTIGKNEISIKLALKYEVESHKIVEIVFGDCVFTTGGNFETTWEAGKEAAIASYVGKTLEEVVALDAPSGSQVVTGATRTSAAVLEAIKMAAGTVLPAPVETTTTEEVTYTTTIGGKEISIKLALKYEVESHKIVEIVFGECVFTTGGSFETTWEAGKEAAIAAYVGKTLEEVIAIDAPSGNQVVTGTTQTSKALLAAIQMAAGTVGNSDSEFVVNSATGELTGYNGTDSEVVIPSTVGDVTITKIGDGAFSNNTTITKVTIPNTVTSVSAGAFTGATNLTEVVFEQGATGYVTITGSFKGLTKLTTVTLPTKSMVMASAFEGCTSLATVEGMGGIFMVGENAFKGCTSLTTVQIGAFNLADSAFEGCTSLTSFTFTSSSMNGEILNHDNIFKGCTSLETFEIPKGATKISVTAFLDCSKLKLTVNAENTKYFAKDGVLYNGNNLVFVPAGVTSFEIPATVTNIGNMQTALVDAYNVTAITVAAENTKYVADNGVLYTAGYTQLVFIPSAIGPSFEIRPETTTVGVMAFAHSTGIQTITVNEANTKFKVIDSILYFETSANSFYLVTVADRTAAKEVTILGGNTEYTLSTVMSGAFDHGQLTGIKFVDANHIGTGWANVELDSTMTITATRACETKINSNMSTYKDRVSYID